MNGKEFPNNWDEIAEAPDEMFDTCTYEEFMIGMSNWHIPSSHAVIMRVTNTSTGKVTEHSYRKMGHARNKLIKLVDDPANEIVVCDNDSIHLIKQQNHEPDLD